MLAIVVISLFTHFVCFLKSFREWNLFWSLLYCPSCCTNCRTGCSNRNNFSVWGSILNKIMIPLRGSGFFSSSLPDQYSVFLWSLLSVQKHRYYYRVGDDRDLIPCISASRQYGLKVFSQINRSLFYRRCPVARLQVYSVSYFPTILYLVVQFSFKFTLREQLRSYPAIDVVSF